MCLGASKPLQWRLSAPSKHSSTMVGEAYVHVQGESPKTYAALHWRLSNSPVTSRGTKLDVFILGTLDRARGLLESIGAKGLWLGLVASLLLPIDPALSEQQFAEWPVNVIDAPEYGCLAAPDEAPSNARVSIFTSSGSEQLQVWVSLPDGAAPEGATISWDGVPDQTPASSVDDKTIRFSNDDLSIREHIRTASSMTVVVNGRPVTTKLGLGQSLIGALLGCASVLGRAVEAQDDAAIAEADGLKPAGSTAEKQMWCGTALAIAQQPSGYDLIAVAADSYRSAGYSDEEVAKVKSDLLHELQDILNNRPERAEYTFEECAALAADAPPAAPPPDAYSATSPMKVNYKQTGTMRLDVIEIQSLVDDLVLKNVVVNRGTCFQDTSFPAAMRLQFGQVTRLAFPGCRPVEVTAETNFGEWTFTF
jgi:hypothetical protein